MESFTPIYSSYSQHQLGPSFSLIWQTMICFCIHIFVSSSHLFHCSMIGASLRLVRWSSSWRRRRIASVSWIKATHVCNINVHKNKYKKYRKWGGLHLNQRVTSNRAQTVKRSGWMELKTQTDADLWATWAVFGRYETKRFRRKRTSAALSLLWSLKLSGEPNSGILRAVGINVSIVVLWTTFFRDVMEKHECVYGELIEKYGSYTSDQIYSFCIVRTSYSSDYDKLEAEGGKGLLQFCFDVWKSEFRCQLLCSLLQLKKWFRALLSELKSI